MQIDNKTTGRAAGQQAPESQVAPAALLLSLPVDRPRPASPDLVAGHLPIPLDTALVAGLRSLGTAAGADLSSVLLAHWANLLARLSGQCEFSVGLASRGDDVAGSLLHLNLVAGPP